MKTRAAKPNQQQISDRAIKSRGPAGRSKAPGASSVPPSFSTQGPRRNGGNQPSRLATLSVKRQAQVFAWLAQDVPYKTIAARLKKHFGVTLSISRLCRIYQAHIEPEPAKPKLTPLLDVTVMANGLPFRIRVDGIAGATVSTEGVK